MVPTVHNTAYVQPASIQADSRNGHIANTVRVYIQNIIIPNTHDLCAVLLGCETFFVVVIDFITDDCDRQKCCECVRLVCPAEVIC